MGNMKEKVLVAMSAVAALLLTWAGYDCTGVTLKFFRADDTAAAAGAGCWARPPTAARIRVMPCTG
ncbi:MAG: hypothetical protein LBS10_11865 [Gracilibacteraceae bacterium]|jgi:tRNA U34 2-thiouridine synthase MnmA/TrmU|nr:hypothetical protein [Gracilibacteraceae bacterium]